MITKFKVVVDIDDFYITSKFGVKRLTWKKGMGYLRTRPALTTLSGIPLWIRHWQSIDSAQAPIIFATDPLCTTLWTLSTRARGVRATKQSAEVINKIQVAYS